MPKLPILHWKTLEKIYERKGYYFWKQKGTHRSYVHEKTKKILQLVAQKEIPKGTLNMKIRHLGITRKEFFDLLKEIGK